MAVHFAAFYGHKTLLEEILKRHPSLRNKKDKVHAYLILFYIWWLIGMFDGMVWWLIGMFDGMVWWDVATFCKDVQSSYHGCIIFVIFYLLMTRMWYVTSLQLVTSSGAIEIVARIKCYLYVFIFFICIVPSYSFCLNC